MLQVEVEAVYKAANKAAKKYVRHWIQSTDSEAVADVVQHIAMFSVRYWNTATFSDCPLQKKCEMLAAKGLLHAMRASSAPHKVVRSVQDKKRCKRSVNVCRVWGKENDKAIEELSLSVHEQVERRLDTERVLSYPEFKGKQRELVQFVLETDPDTLTEFPTTATRQAVSEVFNRVLKHLEG